MADEKEAAPAFQFYPKDFWSSTNVMAMTDAEVGVYLRLLSMQWLDLSIPADLAVLARKLRKKEPELRRMWEAIGPCFDPVPGEPEKLQNKRLEEERRKQRERRDKRSAAGRIGAEVRHQSHGNRIANANQPSDRKREVATTDALAKPSPAFASAFAPAGERPKEASVSLSGAHAGAGQLQGSGGEKPVELEAAWGNGFLQAWGPYPNKRGGEDGAARAWFDACRAGDLVADGEALGERGFPIVRAIANLAGWAKSDEWTESGGQFVPKFQNCIRDGIYRVTPPAPGSRRRSREPERSVRRTAGGAPEIAEGYNPLAPKGTVA